MSEPTIDGQWDEARRTAALVLLAIMDGDHQAAADLVRTFDSPRDAWVATATLAAGMFRDTDEGRVMLAAYGWDGVEPDDDSTPTGKARAYLRERLGDGKRHPYTLVRAGALAQGIRLKTLSNAAFQLGVKRGKANGPDHYYQLPKPKGRAR